MPYKDPAKQKAAQARWYINNKVEYAEVNKTRKQVLRAWLTEYKRGKPCADCDGVFDPVAMDYDHLPGFEKEARVSQVHLFGTIERLLAEIAKCELVCANCHRVRTKSRLEGTACR